MKRWTPVLLMILIVAGPVWAMKVQTFYRQGADFSQYKTYALTVPEPDPKKDPDGHSKRIWQQIRAAAAETLEGQGLVEVEPDKADLHFIYAGSVTAGAYGAFWEGTGAYSGLTLGSAKSYAAGTVVLEFLSPESNDVIWRGAADPGFGQMDDFDKILKQVDKTVRKILKSYPPKRM